MNRAEKSQAVEELNSTFQDAAVVVVTRNLGLTVAASTDLRSQMRDAGASYKVAKNRLARIALDDGCGEAFLVGPKPLGTVCIDDGDASRAR